MKRRIVTIITGLALLLAVAGSVGIAADSVGLSVTSQTHACNTSSASGGGC